MDILKSITEKIIEVWRDENPALSRGERQWHYCQQLTIIGLVVNLDTGLFYLRGRCQVCGSETSLSLSLLTEGKKWKP